MGGIKRVLVANADDVVSVAFTDDIISGITMASAGTPPVAATFKEYLFRPGTGSMTSEYQVDEAAGSQYVQTLLSLAFSRMETSKRLEITALAIADCVAIVEDNNGKFWYLGYDNPLHLNAGGGESGTARSDRNGYTITLQDDSKELPFEVSSSIISGLL